MSSATIEPGAHLLARDAFGVGLHLRALSGIETDGHNFPIVWVERPLSAGGTDRVPWPADAIRLSVKEV